jgi:hypothetical protein
VLHGIVTSFDDVYQHLTQTDGADREIQQQLTVVTAKRADPPAGLSRDRVLIGLGS